MSRSLILRPSAKINLTLRVGPRRSDGYHDVRSLMQSIALNDTLTLTPRRGPFALMTRAPGVPTDHSNLVWRAADHLWRAAKRIGDPRDVHAKLDKNIPAAAGLGGGSANAAAALVGLNVMWDLRMPRHVLIGIGAELGSDVPFFLQGGTALAAGRGEEIYPVDDIERVGLIVIKPSFGVATAEAYQWLDDDRAASLPEARAASRGVDVGWPTGPIALTNDLEAPVARRHPVIAEIVAALLREGALGAAMTGSGSAVFGVFTEATARRARARLQRPDWLVVLTRSLARREAGRRLGL